MNPTSKPEPPPDPSKIPAFDRAMRGLIQVPKTEVDERIKRDGKQKKPPKNK
jgi:hypothetical protein